MVDIKKRVAASVCILLLTMSIAQCHVVIVDDTDLTGCTVQLSSYIFNLKALSKSNTYFLKDIIVA